MLVLTVVISGKCVFPVQVLNLAPEDAWLPPKARLGILSQGHRVEGGACDVAFMQMARDDEEVTLSVRSMTETPSYFHCPSDRVQMGGTPEQQAALRALLRQYADVFAMSDDDIGYTEVVEHEIPVMDEIPVAQANRRIPPKSI